MAGCTWACVFSPLHAHATNPRQFPYKIPIHLAVSVFVKGKTFRDLASGLMGAWGKRLGQNLYHQASTKMCANVRELKTTSVFRANAALPSLRDVAIAASSSAASVPSCPFSCFCSRLCRRYVRASMTELVIVNRGDGITTAPIVRFLHVPRPLSLSPWGLRQRR